MGKHILEQLISGGRAFHVTTQQHIDSIRSGVKFDYNRRKSDETDFGYGFYIHATRKAAVDYTKALIRHVGDNSKFYIAEFEFRCSQEEFVDDSVFKFIELNEYNNDFAEFVFNNRSNNRRGTMQHDFDIVAGCMTSGNPTDVMADYYTNVLTKEEVIDKFKTPCSRRQICLCTSKACSRLTYISDEPYEK